MTWIKLFYTRSCVQNNGWSRQGCPLWPYLFILCAEVLGNAIRRDEIRGIKISGTGCKLSQYADDTTMILDGSELSFSRTLYLLEVFADISGLKVNYEKADALWIGSLKNSNTIISSNKPITWAERKVYALGVWFSTSDLKRLRHEDFAILGQICAKIITKCLYSYTKCSCKAMRKISNEFYQGELTIITFW